MENASKALLISGGILIAMLVLAIGVYLFSSYKGLGSSYNRNIDATEIQKFNSNFTKFEGRTDIKIQEIVSVAKFAKQYEEKNEIATIVYLEGEGNLAQKNEENLIEIIQDKSASDDGEIIKFSTGEIFYNDNGMVSKISFIISD